MLSKFAFIEPLPIWIERVLHGRAFYKKMRATKRRATKRNEIVGVLLTYLSYGFDSAAKKEHLANLLPIGFKTLKLVYIYFVGININKLESSDAEKNNWNHM
jgi:hypothetical protein